MIALRGRCREVRVDEPLDSGVWALEDSGKHYDGAALIARSERDESSLGVYPSLESLPGDTSNAVVLPPELDYLRAGDFVAFSPDGWIVRVVWRRASKQNFLLLTERCDNYCLMCSQPPKETEDSYLLRQAMELARRLPTDVEAVTLTGGEPTLYGDGLLELLRVFRDRLPATHVQLLTNGRRFSDGRFATDYSVSAGAAHIAAIPLYGAEPRRHDYVVQSEGAFDETVRGILNLARLEKRIELRVVLHKQTIPALSDIAEFISRNLPFVDRVALMGLEITGLTRPGGSLDRSYDYRGELSDALSILENASVPTLLYNHQLCLLEPATRHFAVKSISDWKNEYFPECEGCRLREECGGFFQSARIRRSAHVMAL